MTHIFGNWKMYLDYDESNILANQLVQESFSDSVSLTVFSTALAFADIQKTFDESSIALGAQNVSWVSKGAYTGATSAYMYKELGAQYALVGHSERRHIFGEGDSDVRKKIEACLDAGLIPVVCIGETQDDFDNNKREYRLKKQLESALKDLKIADNQLIIAYEPVWAITGSGNDVSCEPQEVAAAHMLIRQEISTYTNAHIPLLYGGSVSAEDVLSYTTLDCVDGVLVGSKSTSIDTFVPLIRAVESQE